MRLEVRKLLYDACEAGRAVVAFVEGKTVSDYQGDLLLRSAVERQLLSSERHWLSLS